MICIHVSAGAGEDRLKIGVAMEKEVPQLQRDVTVQSRQIGNS